MPDTPWTTWDKIPPDAPRWVWTDHDGAYRPRLAVPLRFETARWLFDGDVVEASDYTGYPQAPCLPPSVPPMEAAS